MVLAKSFLYPSLDDDTIYQYSHFKFGDVSTLLQFSDAMSTLISSHIENTSTCVLYTTNKYPTKSYYKKNSLLLAEHIARQLSLPLVVGEYTYQYSDNTFYDNQTTRKIHTPQISEKDATQYHDYTFLMLDDSFVTGQTLQVSVTQLEHIAKDIYFFSIIDLSDQSYTEKEINSVAFTRGGIPFIVSLLYSPGYVLTTQMLRTIVGLSSSQLTLLSQQLDPSKKNLLKKSFFHYLNIDFIFP